MNGLLNMLRTIGFSRLVRIGRGADMSVFDRRMKMISRARMVDAAGLGTPVFRTRQTRRAAAGRP